MRRAALILAAALSLLAGTAGAQGIEAAIATYRGLSGSWVAPGGNCATGANVWTFSRQSIRTPRGTLNVRGIGGNGGLVRIDPVAGRPFQIRPTAPGRVTVTGIGLPIPLSRCGRTDSAPAPSPAPDPVDPPQEVPDPEERPEDLVAPAPDLPDGADETATAARFRSDIEGRWQSPGAETCDWQFSEARISGPSSGYDVVRFVGDGGTIGVNTLDDEGAPVTLSLTPGPDGLSVSGGPDGSTRLRRCPE